MTLCVVAVACAAAALPFGDAASGWDFAAGPAVAASLEVLLLGRSHTLRRAAFAAGTTLVLMLATVILIAVFWGFRPVTSVG